MCLAQRRQEIEKAKVPRCPATSTRTSNGHDCTDNFASGRHRETSSLRRRSASYSYYSRWKHLIMSRRLSTVRPTLSHLRHLIVPNPTTHSIAYKQRSFHSTGPVLDFHFDTHHFVQRLEREGLNRAQAEGIMTALAEVIDESIRNMTSNMVTKADQEKVSFKQGCISPLSTNAAFRTFATRNLAPIHPESRLCSTQIRASTHGEERPRNDESRE